MILFFVIFKIFIVIVVKPKDKCTETKLKESDNCLEVRQMVDNFLKRNLPDLQLHRAIPYLALIPYVSDLLEILIADDF